MTYTRQSSLTERGVATGSQIQAWLESRAPAGARYVGLPQVPIPEGLGDIIVEETRVYGLNQDLIAAQIAHESAACQSRIARDKNNYSGYGAENDDPYGKAHTFATPRLGVQVQIAHLMGYIAGDGPWNNLSPRYTLVKQAGNAGVVRTPGDLEQRWAWSPPDRYNATPVSQRYGSRLAAIANELVTFEGEKPEPEEPPMTKPRIALAAGHHNRDRGGAAGEYERVGPLTREIANQLRSHGGFDVHIITPGDGLGDFPGGLQDVAREAVRIGADCFLEVHMEGTGNPAVRGCFAIYPDTPPDVDEEVRDQLGLDMARRVRDRTGLPLRGNGTMSERSTNVGNQGYRLGAFSASASARRTMTRLLFEYGTLTNSADRQIIDGSGFAAQAARATVEALIAFYNVTAAPDEPEPQPDPDALYQTANPFGAIPIRHGFRDLFERIGAAKYPDDPMAGGLSVCGYAEGPEYPTEFGSAQRFQRVTMLYYRDAAPPWDIVLQHRFEAPPERKDAA